MRTVLMALAISFVAAACAATGERQDMAEGGENCVQLSRVDRIEIVDEYNVLFFMNDRTVYNNNLRRKCPGLRRNDTIMYRTSMGRLCDLDMFTVLEDVGFGFTPGPSCSLGTFYPVAREEAEAMKEKRRD